MSAFLTDSGDSALPLTGERTVPGLAEENYWFRRHEVVYRALSGRCANRDVLEAGCGEGYGADLIASVARSVVAVDYDAATVAHVRAKYPRVKIAEGNLASLPTPDGSVDVVVNFQVIEHLWDQLQFVEECRRVLRPGGIVSGPTQMGLVDRAAYAVILAHIGPVAMAVTSNLNMSFLRAVEYRTVMADAELIKLGKRLATVDVRLWQEDPSRVLAQATVTYAIPA